MKIKALIAAALLAIAAPALAFETVSLAYEVALGDVVPPSTPNSSVTFRECRDCERKTIRTTSNTRYRVNGRTVSLDRFKRAIDGAVDRDSRPVTILHHLESDTVVSVSVTLKQSDHSD